MNTIYDGSFVLGQTSATNFVAGPGIKIDEPSAGTVRIGNDETVLWEGDATSATLSDSVDNFEKFVITYKYWPDRYTTQTIYGWSGQPTYTEGWFDNNVNAAAIFFTRLTINDAHTVIGSDANKYWNPPAGGSLVDALGSFAIIKVIGINRINA